ncbi:ABC transporter permease [Mycoplasmatota bacterium WC30]
MEIIAIIIANTIAFGIPLLLVALAGMFSERSGVVNIALEGIMVFGSLFGAIFLSTSIVNSGLADSNPQLIVIIAMLISAIAGTLFSLLLAYASIKLKANQIISGTALNMFAPAFAIIIAWAIQGQGLTDIVLPEMVNIDWGLDPASVPLWVDTLLTKKMYITTPLSLVVLLVAFITLYKTKFGLRLRSCGEHPQAADSVGINVIRMRYIGVGISGFLAGIGGFAYVMASSNSTFTGDVAGYGFLALAVMIFGNWKPFKIFFAALFFSFFKTISALAVDDQLARFFPTFNLQSPENLYRMLPYLITLVVLAFTSKKSRAPKAEGIPYDPGKR